MQCAQVEVPVDYSQPQGRTTHVAVSKISASSGRATSTIFGNPGGPGTDSLLFWMPDPDGGNPEGLYTDHDLVAVQPRGLFGSNPVQCNPAAIGPVSLNHLHDACYGTDPQFIASLTTANAARDMDTVRQAMGLAQIDYLGVSYGTKLGADYATLFPERVGRMVLDSNVGPNWAWGEQAARTSEAQHARIYDMFQWIADHNDEYDLGTTPLQVFYSWKWITDQEIGGSPNLIPPAAQPADLPPQLRGTALERPALDAINASAPARARAEGLAQTLLLRPWLNTAASGVYDATVGASMDEYAWPFVANVLRHYNTGGALPRVDLMAAQRIRAAREAGPALNTQAGMFQMITCNENSTPVNPLLAVAAMADQATGGDALLTGAAAQRAGADCLGYPPVTRALTPSGAGLATKPLVVQNLRDAVTPPQGGQEMAAAMGVPMLGVPAGGHGVFRTGNKPVDDAILAFFKDGTIPALPLPGIPAPTPLPRDLETPVSQPGGYAPAAGVLRDGTSTDRDAEGHDTAPSARTATTTPATATPAPATPATATPATATPAPATPAADLDQWYGTSSDGDQAAAAVPTDPFAATANQVAVTIDGLATTLTGVEQTGAQTAVHTWLG